MSFRRFRRARPPLTPTPMLEDRPCPMSQVTCTPRPPACSVRHSFYSLMLLAHPPARRRPPSSSLSAHSAHRLRMSLRGVLRSGDSVGPFYAPTYTLACWPPNSYWGGWVHRLPCVCDSFHPESESPHIPHSLQETRVKTAFYTRYGLIVRQPAGPYVCV